MLTSPQMTYTKFMMKDEFKCWDIPLDYQPIDAPVVMPAGSMHTYKVGFADVKPFPIQTWAFRGVAA